MTAISVFIGCSAVQILTDGKVSSIPNNDQFGTSKVFQMPHVNAAMATRGPARLLGLMGMLLCAQASTFEDMVAVLGRLRKCARDFKEPWQAEVLSSEFDVVLAGIGKDGPAAYIVSSHGKHGTEPWAVDQIDKLLCTPPIPQPQFEFLASQGTNGVDMGQVLDLQRLADPDAVGVFGTLTTIERGSIATRMVRDWRSRPYEMKPTAAHSPAPVMMNSAFQKAAARP